MTDVPFDSAAREEFFDAVDYYRAESAQLAIEFIAAVDYASELIASFPELGTPYLAGTRRMLVQRFPYSLVYVVDETGTLVVALAHHRRQPGYWRDRL